MARRVLVGIGVGLLGGVVAWAWDSTSLGRQTEAQTYDWRLAAQPTPARRDIAIVEINESSIRAMAPIVGRWPWPRLMHAGVITYLANAGARVIVYDVQLTEADTQGHYRIGDRIVTGPESDAELIAAVRRAGNVVLLADAVFEGFEPGADAPPAIVTMTLPGTTYVPGAGLIARSDVHLPFPALRHAAAAVGHNLMIKDAGGGSRAIHPFIDAQGTAIPSLGLAAVLLASTAPPEDVRLRGRQLRVGEVDVPLLENGQALLKLHGPMTAEGGASTFLTHPIYNVLLSQEHVSGGEPPVIPAEDFRDKIVFVGTSATGLADIHATAFGGNTPGVFLQATLADNILSGEFMRRASETAGLGLTFAGGLAAGIAAVTLPVWSSLAVVIALGVGWVGLATFWVGAGTWAPVVAPVMAAGVALVGGLAWQYFIEGREKRQVKRLFGRYVSPAIFQQLMVNPSIARLGGERRQMSVLFSDIRGFTAASEHGEPEAIVAQLNEYFSAMVDVLFAHQGTLDKFVGDQVMGLFGAPVADERHADHAVASALAMSERLDQLNARWATEGRQALQIGIGINSGEMIAGNIGSEAIMSYTVIGDAVNLGARLESLNKEHGTRILMSDATKNRLTIAVRSRLVGTVQVKGRHESVVVHEVLAPEGGGSR